MIHVQGQQFELIENGREGWNEEAFKERYSEVLNKYDFVVGDWGHNQLRLRGFFHDNHKKASFDSKVSSIYDYLYEYCNFGCAYFVLKRVTPNSKEDKNEELAPEEV
ncbi:YutD family protein [Salsuginibacillus kocurii]|uniref:YutD family protein n=1 Tax=Salsuginibacillus kocurii TaxID=427078 RepID=UPI0003755A99|nr:YutD family protein [Salsuginibacillus kocurii]